MSDYTTLIQQLKDHTQPLETLKSALYELPENLPEAVLMQFADLMLNDPYQDCKPEEFRSITDWNIAYPIRGLIASQFRNHFSGDIWQKAILNDCVAVVESAFYSIKPQLVTLDLSQDPNKQAYIERALIMLDSPTHAFSAISLLGCANNWACLRKLGATAKYVRSDYGDNWDEKWVHEQEIWGWGYEANATKDNTYISQSIPELTTLYEGNPDHKEMLTKVIVTLLNTVYESLRVQLVKLLHKNDETPIINRLNDNFPPHVTNTIIQVLLEDGQLKELVNYCVQYPAQTTIIIEIKQRIKAIQNAKQVESLVNLLFDDNPQISEAVTGLFPLSQFNPDAVVTLILGHITTSHYPETIKNNLERVIKHGEMDFTLPILNKLKELPDEEHILYDLAKMCLDKTNLVGGLVILQSSNETRMDANSLDKLLTKLGISTLTRNYLTNDYRSRMDTLWKNSETSWKQSIDSARFNYWILLLMSMIIFLIGITLLLIPVGQLASQQIKLETAFSTGLSLLTGLGLIISLFYGGPFKNINNTINRLNRTHVAFVGFMTRISQIAIAFEHEYTYGDLNGDLDKETSKLEKFSKLLDDATDDIAKTLLVNEERKSTEILAEEIEKQMMEQIKKQINPTDTGQTNTEQ